jgi:hypothetical protein
LTSGTCFRRLGFDAHVLCRLGLRAQRRVTEQRVGQRLQPGLAGDLCLGAALLLVGQVEVFEALLVVGGSIASEFRRQLALLVDRRQDGGAAVFQFAQVAQAVFEIAQLRVVEVVGDFLAVAGDEGHGGALVEQLHGGSTCCGRTPSSVAMRCAMRVWSLADMGVKKRKGRAP